MKAEVASPNRRWSDAIAQVIAEYPIPSSTAWTLYGYVANGGNVIDRVVEILALDPLLAAEALRLANLANYGAAHAEALPEAVSVLGCDAVSRLALTACLRRLAVRELAVYDTSADAFYLKSVACAAAMDYLSGGGGNESGSDMYTIGLLHSIGEIFIDSALSGNQDEPIRLIGSPPRKLAWIEERFLGVNQAAVGGMALRSWGFPERIYAPIENQFADAAEGPHSRAAQALCLARYIGARTMEFFVKDRPLGNLGANAIYLGRPVAGAFERAVANCREALGENSCVVAN